MSKLQDKLSGKVTIRKKVDHDNCCGLLSVCDVPSGCYFLSQYATLQRERQMKHYNLKSCYYIERTGTPTKVESRTF